MDNIKFLRIKEFFLTKRHHKFRKEVSVDLAGDAAMREGIAKNAGYLETRNLKVSAIKDAIKKKIKLFKSDNRI